MTLNIKRKTQDDVIFIDERFSLWRDRFQWILYKFPNGRLKEDGTKRDLPSGISSDKTYHPTLEQLVDYLVEAEVKEVEALEDILPALYEIKDDILECMETCTEPWNKIPAKTTEKAPPNDS